MLDVPLWTVLINKTTTENFQALIGNICSAVCSTQHSYAHLVPRPSEEVGRHSEDSGLIWLISQKEDLHQESVSKKDPTLGNNLNI